MKFSQVLAIPKGTKIKSFVVKGPGKSRGEPALVYLIRNKKGGKASEKRIRQSEWDAALQYIKAHGEFTFEAFHATMPDAAKDGECNFHFTWGALLYVSQRNKSSGPQRVSTSRPKKGMPLVPELVPRPLWGRSVFRMLRRNAKWKQIRFDALAASKNRCSICESKNRTMSCHEQWKYDDDSSTAILLGFEIHCSNCDAATHFGNAVNRGPSGEILPAILKHICTVNQCAMREAQSILVSAFEQWKQRSKKPWNLMVDGAILERYPELAALPEFIPPQFGL